MSIKKTLSEREKELRLLLQSNGGEIKLQELASNYAAAEGHHAYSGGSVITQIIVYERLNGIISV
jgi:hypothetical protein